MSLGPGDLSSTPPESSAAARKRKKKMDGKLTTSFSLPRLDEMVLLKPISTCETRSPSKKERTRTDSINEELVRYNRWLQFTHSSNPGTRVRLAAMKLQQTIHELNTAMAEMMIRIDRKMVDLQNRTDVFVGTFKAGDLWQTNGDLLELQSDELDNALIKHPQRGTEALSHQIRDLIKNEAVRSCPNGAYEAFHLYVFVKAHIFSEWETDTFGIFGNETDIEKADSRMLEIIKEFHLDSHRKGKQQPITFLNFAAARREIWNSMPANCTACERQQLPPGPTNPSYILPPFSPCRRSSNLNIIERLQKESYGEIRAGIILTLPSKLPRELCLLVFEFAMVSEEIPLDPRVWEPGIQSDGGNVFEKPLKAMYRCPVHTTT